MEATNSEENTWLIIYKADDALKSLREMMKQNLELVLTPDEPAGKLLISSSSFSNKKLLSRINGQQKEIIFSKDSKEVSLELPDPIEDFALWDDQGELIRTKSFSSIEEGDQISENSMIRIERLSQRDRPAFRIKREYAPKAVEAVNSLISSGGKGGTIYLMNSSHQDIAWMDTPEKCVIERDTMLLTPLLNKASVDTSYRFDVEDALMFKEYISRHPEKKDLISKLLKGGRLSCGSTYIQPYEEMYSGESLIRQFYLGARWLKKEFGYNADTYWNVDVPGRTLQMPQIASKAGTKYLIMSRHEEGIYNWFAPDGSFITSYSPGHYADAMIYLTKDFFAAVPSLASHYLKWSGYFNPDNKIAVPLLSDWDMSPAKDYSHLINRWHNIQNTQEASSNTNLPRISISLAPDFMKRFTSSASAIPSLRGERPQVWLYIQSPSHYQALSSSRRGDILLTAAEKFCTINSLLNKSFSFYPAHNFLKAWEAKIYPDHGWGGKGGEVTDALFKEKFIFAENEAKRLLSGALAGIASNIKTDKSKGIPVVLFNSISRNRTSPVKVFQRFDSGNTHGVSITDAAGSEIQCQLSSTKFNTDGSINETEINFLAGDVPSLGYKTYYINSEKQKSESIIPHDSLTFSNSFYTVTFSPRGISGIYDKQLRHQLIDTSKFFAGEVFMLRSVGEDAGEFSDIQKPDTQEFDRTGNYPIKWIKSEEGKVYTSFKFRRKIKYAVIEEEVIIYNLVKKIDFNIAILNWEGVMFREFRTAFPLNMTGAQVSYEVPFGIVNVGQDEIKGAAGERYKTECALIHPRGIENWIASSDENVRVILSSTCGVADYIDPTDNSALNPVLQPVMLASRRSCHGEGNEYPQTGDHYYHFSLTSLKPGSNADLIFGRETNERLFPVVNPRSYADAALPEELSFFSTGSEDVLISTIKKAEDEDAPVIRVYNTGNKDTSVNLRSYFDLGQVHKSNIIELDPEKIDVPKADSYLIPVGKYSIETFLFR